MLLHSLLCLSAGWPSHAKIMPRSQPLLTAQSLFSLRLQAEQGSAHRAVLRCTLECLKHTCTAGKYRRHTAYPPDQGSQLFDSKLCCTCKDGKYRRHTACPSARLTALHTRLGMPKAPEGRLSAESASRGTTLWYCSMMPGTAECAVPSGCMQG